jgi:hypothetical protein
MKHAQRTEKYIRLNPVHYTTLNTVLSLFNLDFTNNFHSLYVVNYLHPSEGAVLRLIYKKKIM